MTHASVFAYTGCPRSRAPPKFFKKFIDQLSQTGIIIKQNILKVYKLNFF